MNTHRKETEAKVPTSRTLTTFARLVEDLSPSVITQGELATAVGATERTVQNWSSARSRPRGETVDRLLDVVHLVTELRDVYTDEGIQIWLRSRNRHLGHRRPIELLAEGRVDDVLDEVQRVVGGM